MVVKQSWWGVVHYFETDFFGKCMTPRSQIFGQKCQKISGMDIFR
jgi:hypothetical protein